MFGPDYTAGCASCSMIVGGFNGFAVHLANHDVMLWAVSRAPLAKLAAVMQTGPDSCVEAHRFYRARLGGP